MKSPDRLCVGCPVQHALSFIGGKWQMGILWSLRAKPQRFRDVRRQLPGLSEKVLAANLRAFERGGMVAKEIFAEIPPRTEYRLTAQGRRLLRVLRMIMKWSYRHLQEETVHRRMRFTPVRAARELAQL